MFYRALVGAIILFWLTMTVLLARLTWFPQSAPPVEVPTAYLWRLMFLHEESSDLVLYNGRQRLGNLHFQPHRQAVAGDGSGRPVHQLTTAGGFNLELPWGERQSVIVRGYLDLGDQDEVVWVRLSAVFQTPKSLSPGTTFLLDGSPRLDRWHYSWQRGALPAEERTGTVAELLDRPDLRTLGLDPGAMIQAQSRRAGALTVTSHHGKLQMNRDEIDTYVVTIRDANGAEGSVHLNQLGQILAVKTSVGISLLEGTLNP